MSVAAGCHNGPALAPCPYTAGCLAMPTPTEERAMTATGPTTPPSAIGSWGNELVPAGEVVDAELIEEDEFWMDAAPAVDTYGVDIPGKVRGRYIYPDPPGYERAKGATTGFMRMTNLASAFSD